MAWQWTPFAIPLLIAAAVSAVLAIYVWLRRPTPGAALFTLLMLAVTEWSLGYTLELGSIDLATKIFWARVQYFGIVIVPTVWLVFALQYTGREKWLTRRNLLLLAIAPLVTLLLVWTNDAHHLIYAHNRLDVRDLYSAMDPTYGPWFWVHMAYSYLVLFLGTFLVVQTFARSPHLYRGQMVAVLIGLVVPWVVNVVSVFVMLLVPRLDLNLDLTPFVFTFTGLAVTWGLFRFRLLDIVPIARGTVIEGMGNGVIALDMKNRIVDLNPAAARIIGCTAAEAVGQPVAQAFSALPDLVERCHDVPTGDSYLQETCTDISVGEDKAQRYFDLYTSPLRNRRGRLVGRLVLLYDVTDRKHAEEVLLRRNRELALFNHAGQAFTSTLDLDQVLIVVLEEVRRLLGIAICSVWLMDPETGELVCRHATGPKSDLVCGWRLVSGQGLTGWVFQHGKCLIVRDTRTDERHFKGVDEHTRWELRSILSVPLHVKDRVIGTLDAADTEVDRFTPADLTLIESMAATAAIAIENARLYDQARQDAETKAMLLDEVNHRVKNNLSAIVGLLYAEQSHVQAEARSMVQDLIGRVQGLAAVHQLLSASEWSPLPLSELAIQVIRSSLHTLSPEKSVSVEAFPSPVRVTPKQANSMALVVNELTTNTVKYALQERDAARIDVHVALEGDIALFEFRDDGPGYPQDVLQQKRQGMGLNLVRSIVRDELRGELALHNDPGAVATIRFKLEL